MSTEIERKFLVLRDQWHEDPAQGTRYRQGYLSVDPDRVVRVRTEGDRAFLTIKGRTSGVARDEYEFAIPLADAEELLGRLCLRPLIEKVRHRIPYDGHRWEVDVFSGANEGLVVAELELRSANEPFTRPPWLGREVSADPRYFNANLVSHPFTEWSR